MKGEKKGNSASLYITCTLCGLRTASVCRTGQSGFPRLLSEIRRCRRLRSSKSLIFIIISVAPARVFVSASTLSPALGFFFLPLSRAFRAPAFCRTTTRKLFGFFFFFCNSVDDVVAAINGKKRNTRRAQKYLIYICRCIIFRGRQKKSGKGKIVYDSENKRNHSCGARYTSSAIVCFRIFYRGIGTRDSGTGSLHNNLVIETTYRGLDGAPFVRGWRRDKSSA